MTSLISSCLKAFASSGTIRSCREARPWPDIRKCSWSGYNGGSETGAGTELQDVLQARHELCEGSLHNPKSHCFCCFRIITVMLYAWQSFVLGHAVLQSPCWWSPMHWRFQCVWYPSVSSSCGGLGMASGCSWLEDLIVSAHLSLCRAITKWRSWTSATMSSLRREDSSWDRCLVT